MLGLFKPRSECEKKSMDLIDMIFPHSLSDDVILAEADRRGLHMGVSELELENLVSAMLEEDWAQVRYLITKLARQNLGRII